MIDGRWYVVSGRWGKDRIQDSGFKSYKRDSRQKAVGRRQKAVGRKQTTDN